MNSRLLLISADSGLVRSVKAALGSIGSLLQINDLADEGGRLEAQFEPNGIIIDSDTRGGVQTVFERIAEARRRFPGLPVVAMGNEMSAQVVLAAMRAGAVEFIDREAGADQIRQAVQSSLTRHGEPRRKSNACVLGILSAIPSEQDQDFSLNLALRAALAQPGKPCLYIDLALPATQAGMALGLDLKFDVADAIREIARLDASFLESAVARDPRSGLYVMPLAREFGPESVSLDAENFGALLHVLQGVFGVIVIGCGPFSRQQALLEMAGPTAKFFLCCNQRFASVRAAGELLRWLAEIDIAAVPDLIVHQPVPGLTPSADDIGKALHLPEAIALFGAWKDMTTHFNDQKPMAVEKSTPYGISLDLCLARAGLAPEPEAGFAGRVLGWLGLPKRAVVS